MVIEVAYALPNEQIILIVRVQEGCKVVDAIESSGVLERFPEIDLLKNKVGVFGKITSLDTALQVGDRVEIYRPLIIDPKQARRERAKR